MVVSSLVSSLTSSGRLEVEQLLYMRHCSLNGCFLAGVCVKGQCVSSLMQRAVYSDSPLGPDNKFRTRPGSQVGFMVSQEKTLNLCTEHRIRTYSLTTLMPSDWAEPTMLLTMVSRELFLILKQSSLALTWAISYTVLTDTMPAVSWPSHTEERQCE